MSVEAKEGCIKEDLYTAWSFIWNSNNINNAQIERFVNEVNSFVDTWQGDGQNAVIAALYGVEMDARALYATMSAYITEMADYLQGVYAWEADSAKSAGTEAEEQ